MSTHTPGPWIALDLGAQRDDDSPIVIHAAQQEVDIAIMANDCELKSEIRANAAFIVRACNSHEVMLEALKAALQAIDAMPPAYAAFPYVSSRKFEIEKALRLAEGWKP